MFIVTLFLVLPLLGLLAGYLARRGVDRVRLLCPACGGEVARDHLACPHCGSRLQSVCPGCGEPVRSLWKVCPRCGMPLGDGSK